MVRLVAHVRGTQALEGPDLGLLALEEDAISRASQHMRSSDSGNEEACSGSDDDANNSGTTGALSRHCSCCGQAAAPP